MAAVVDQLSETTSIFGLKLWAVIGIGVGIVIVLLLFCLSLWLSSRKKTRPTPQSRIILIPKISKEIMVDRAGMPIPKRLTDTHKSARSYVSEDTKIEKELLQSEQGASFSERSYGATKSSPEKDIEEQNLSPTSSAFRGEGGRLDRIQVSPTHKGLAEAQKRGGHQSVEAGSSASGGSRSTDSTAPSSSGRMSGPEVSHLGWGHWYTLRELELATDSFSDSTVLGEGGYGIVYRGQLPDGNLIAVKNLLNTRGQAEKEFKVEVEAIGRARHKNLVRLLGYCMEGSHRYLIQFLSKRKCIAISPSPLSAFV